MCTSVVELDPLALQTQEVKIGVVLVLCHAEYLPTFQVQHDLTMTLVLLDQHEQMLQKWFTGSVSLKRMDEAELFVLK